MFKTGLEALMTKVAIAAPASTFSPMNALRGAGKSLRRGALVAGVGATGALALGAGMEHESQKKRDRLVYAPMNGSFSA
jgi:hypothetical protein